MLCIPQKLLGADSVLVRKAVIKGGSVVLRQELYSFVEPTPNTFYLGIFPIKVWAYRALQEKQEKRFYRWLLRQVGEKPSYLDTHLVIFSAQQMQKWLFQQGYMTARVDWKIKRLRQTAVVYFYVEEGKRFRVGKFIPRCEMLDVRFFITHLMEHPLRVRRPISYELLQQDRQWWTELFHNKGYVFFSKDLITYQLDTHIADHTADVYMYIKSDSARLKRYVLRKIHIVPESPMCDTLRTTPLTISTYEKTAIIHTHHPDETNWRLVLEKVPLQTGTPLENYAIKKQLMVNGLLAMGIFSYVTASLTQAENDSADLWICMAQNKKQSITLDLEGNTGSVTVVGIAGNIHYAHRSLFRGGERFSLEAGGGIEIQAPAPNQLFHTMVFNAGSDFSVPRFVVPFARVTRKLAPRTSFVVSYTYQRRYELTFTSARAELGYQWREFEDYLQRHKPLKEHRLYPVSVFTFQTLAISDVYRRLSESNPLIRRSLENQRILGANYTFIHDGVYTGRRRWWFYRINVNTAGNLAWLVDRLGGNVAEITGKDYSQFVVADVELRRYISFRFPQNALLVLRGVVGAGLSYGNSTVLPYIKQFFLGGSTSMRAWRLRSLGPGSYPWQAGEALTFRDQTGDIRIEVNAEYRFPLIGFVESAVFIDAGNIWLAREDTARPAGHFDVERFWREVAIGGGVGIRLNFEYFIMRMDAGIKLYDPAIPQPDHRLVVRYLLDREWKGRFWSTYGYPYPFFNFVVALGYPF